jgi:hypothetical protein
VTAVRRRHRAGDRGGTDASPGGTSTGHLGRTNGGDDVDRAVRDRAVLHDRADAFASGDRCRHRWCPGLSLTPATASRASGFPRPCFLMITRTKRFDDTLAQQALRYQKGCQGASAAKPIAREKGTESLARLGGRAAARVAA